MKFLKPLYIFLVLLLLIIIFSACTNFLMTDIDKNFILAVEKKDAIAVQKLLNAGANVNVIDKNGLTMLMRASYRGDVAIVKVLLDNKAFVQTKNRQGKTALIMAQEKGRFEVAQLLKQAKKEDNFKEDNFIVKNISFLFYLIFCWLVVGWYWYCKVETSFINRPHNPLIFILIFLGLGLWLYFSPRSYDGFVITGIETMFKNIEKTWITMSAVAGGFGKSLFDTSGLPFLFQVIKVIIGLACGLALAILWLMSGILLIVSLLAIYLGECVLTLLSNTVRFYYPRFDGNYFYNGMVAVMFLPPVYFTYDGILIPFIKKLGSFFALCLMPFCDFYDWLMVGFFSIASTKRREARKALKEAKTREKKESKKIQKDLKKKNKEAKRVEKESIPKIPIKLDNEQIKNDISYLKTLPDKGHLIKYIGDFRDRFIAKGQVKTYQEIDKVIRAKTDVEKALEDLTFAQEGRYTAKERAQAKYLLETLQAQDAVKKHYNKESLEELRLDIEREKLEAQREEARKRKETARKEIEDLRATQPQQQQPKPKTQADRINERARLEKTIKETIAKNREKDLIDIDERARREELGVDDVQIQKDITIAHWAKIEMEQLQKVERKFG